MMMGFAAILVFTGALALGIGIIAVTVAPQWRRIMRLASGNVEAGFAPLATLAQAEQRIAIRRWAAAPVPPAIHRMRAAA